MKVLYFHQYFATPAQSTGTRSYEFSKKLIERGHSVTMVCGESAKLDLAKTKDKAIRRGNIDGIDVIQILLPYSNNDGLLKRALTFVRFAFKGILIALNEDYDLLFATSTPLTAGIPGIVSKWFRKKKFVFEVRDLWPELPKALGLRNPVFVLGMSVLEKLSYSKADACIGLSPGICEGIKKRSQKGKKVCMIPNGCDIDLFTPLSKTKLELNGVSEGDTVAIFTGAHGIANGLDAVLDTAKELKNRNRNDIKLVLIGDGKLKKHLIERKDQEALSNCLFFNPIPKNQLCTVMASADIGLMVLADIPAFYYGTSPNKFFDYISSGLPIINNYPGWLADMISENRCGEVVEPNNPSSFAEGLIKLADSPELRAEFGKNARQLAVKSFNRNLLSNQFVDFLESV